MVTLSITAVVLAFFVVMFYMYFVKTHKKDDKTYYAPKQGSSEKPFESVEDEGQTPYEPSQNTDVPAEEADVDDIDYNS